MQMVMTPDETQIQILANWPMSDAKRVTRDNWKNPEYRVIAAISKLRPWFSCGTVCLSAVYLTRQWHDILDFSNCPLSRVLYVTLANWQGFGFEFHLGSSPSAFSGFVNISQPAAYFTACYTVLKRPNKVETAVHGCNLAFSLDSIVSLPR